MWDDACVIGWALQGLGHRSLRMHCRRRDLQRRGDYVWNKFRAGVIVSAITPLAKGRRVDSRYIAHLDIQVLLIGRCKAYNASGDRRRWGRYLIRMPEWKGAASMMAAPFQQHRTAIGRPASNRSASFPLLRYPTRKSPQYMI